MTMHISRPVTGAYILMALMFFSALVYQNLTLRADNARLLVGISVNRGVGLTSQSRINTILSWIDPHSSYRMSVDRLLANHYAGTDAVGREVHQILLLAEQKRCP